MKNNIMNDPVTNQQTNQQTNQPNQSKLTIKSIYTDLIPHIPYSALKLYIHYHLSSQTHTINLAQFCQETNTSIDTSYRALNILKEKGLIPQNTIFTNTTRITPHNK